MNLVIPYLIINILFCHWALYLFLTQRLFSECFFFSDELLLFFMGSGYLGVLFICLGGRGRLENPETWIDRGINRCLTHFTDTGDLCFYVMFGISILGTSLSPWLGECNLGVRLIFPLKGALDCLWLGYLYFKRDLSDKKA